MNGRAFFSWSGGKGSMLALHRALARAGVEALLAMFDEGGQRSRSPRSRRLMQAQAEALGVRS